MLGEVSGEDCQEGGKKNVHGDQGERRGKRHSDDAPDHFPAIHALLFRRELLQYGGHLVLREVQSWIHDLVLFTAVDDGLLALLGQRGQGLEPPFFERDAVEGLVAGEGNALLPVERGLGVLLPGDPGLAGLGGDAVEEAALAGGLVVQLLAVDEGAAGGDGQQEEAHCEDGNGGTLAAGGGIS